MKTTDRALPKCGDVAYRTLTVNHERAVDADARTVEIAFSSEEPVERWFGDEVLSHKKSAVRMDRMRSGTAALLVNHDADQQVGVVDSAQLVSGEGKARATVRFGRSDFAEEIFRDVMDGIRTQVSVGYRIHDIEEEQGEDGSMTIRVTDWEPFEASIVAVPADASVGVGRNLSNTGITQEDRVMKRDTNDTLEERDVDTSTSSTQDEVVSATDQRSEDSTQVSDAVNSQDRKNINARIRELGTKYRMNSAAEDLIDVGGSVDDMETAVRQSIINRKPEPIHSSREIRIEGGAPRYKKLKAFKALGEEEAYRSGMWARAHLFGDEKAAAWCKDNHMRVMTTLAISKGGAVVPEGLSQAIIDLREDFGILRSLVRVVPMDTETLAVPRRAGGVTAYFVGQEDATTESDKSWDMVQLVARELSALTRFSRAYAEDAVIDVAEDLANEMAYAFAEKEDDCGINGDGTSTYGGILGMRAKLLLAANAGSIVTADSGVDTYAEMDATDFANIRAKLPAYAETNAKYLMSKAGKNTAIDPLLTAAGGNTKVDLAGRLVDAYLGDPIMVSQKMPTSTGDLSDVIMALYGDFEKACTMGDRRGFSLQVLNERYAEYRQIGVIATERFDFNAHDLGTATAAGPVVGFKGN